MSAYQPTTGQRCACKRGIERDNCPACEGTGWRIDFAAIRDARTQDHSPAGQDNPLHFAAIRARRYPGEAMPRTCHDLLPGDSFNKEGTRK